MGILDDFDREHTVYRDFSSKLAVLLGELLAVRTLRVHSVNTRVKDRASFEVKLGKSPEQYGDLSKMTDICGARIITYFEGDVDSISKVIESEFEIDRRNSVDKRASYDADRFGYVSVHYIASLKQPRSALAEYARFAHLTFELQIRSILQHAWAEIEHDLEYKSQVAIPRELRRRFARLAGLLEVADAEFTGVRVAILDYRHRVVKDIAAVPDQVGVDRESLNAFISESSFVASLDGRIAAVLGVDVDERILESDFALGILVREGVDTIQAVQSVLSDNSDEIVRLADRWLHRIELDSNVTNFSRGISLFYCAYFLLVSNHAESEIIRILSDPEIPPMGGDGPETLAKLLSDTYSHL